MNDAVTESTQIPTASPGLYSRIALLCTVALVLFGIGLRIAAGLAEPGLWLDEIIWFKRITEGFVTGIRAQGYVVLHAIYFDYLRTFEEYKIRITSIVSGIAFVPLFALVVYRLFGSPLLTLLGAGMAAVNVAAISFTHEFKPYALDLFLHTLWFYALVLVQRKRVAVWCSTAVLLAGVTLSYSMLPLMLFQVVYAAFLQYRRQIERADLLGVILVVVLYGAYFAGVYPQIRGANSTLWAKKYGVFYSARLHGEGYIAYLTWFFQKVSTYPALALNWYRDLPLDDKVAGFPKGHGFVEAPLLGLFFVVAVALRVRQIRFDDARLVPVYLLLGYTAAGILRIFPLGYFRSNLFLLTYSALVVLMLVQFIEQRFPRIKGALLALCAIPSILFTVKAPFAQKHFYNLPVRRVVNDICMNTPGPKVTMLGDRKMKATIGFYLNRRMLPACKRRLKVETFWNAQNLTALLGETTERRHVFFAGTNGQPPKVLNAVMYKTPKVTLIQNAGGIFHYVVNDPQSSGALANE